MPMTNREIVSYYALHLELNYAAHSVRNYLSDIEQYLTHLGDKPFAEVDKNVIRRFLWERSATCGKSSLSRKVHVLRTFYRWLVNKKLLQRNPLNLIDNMKVQRPLPVYLSLDQVLKLLESVNGKTLEDLRDRAALEMFYSTGIRCAELVRLDWKDIDWRAGFIRVLGKGSKERIIPIGETALKTLWRYAEAYRMKIKIEPQGTAPVFVPLIGLGALKTHLTTRSVQRLFSKRLAAANIRLNAGPHALRHTMATHMLRAGAGILQIAEMLGHSCVSTTQRYTHIDLHTMRSAYQAAHPRA
jgi:integrase/recombinase XerC